MIGTCFDPAAGWTPERVWTLVALLVVLALAAVPVVWDLVDRVKRRRPR
jgi:hypothetical protein